MYQSRNDTLTEAFNTLHALQNYKQGVPCCLERAMSDADFVSGEDEYGLMKARLSNASAYQQ